MRITIATMSENVKEILNAMNVEIHYPEFGGYIFNVDYVGTSHYNHRDSIKTTPIILNGREMMVSECLYSNQCVLQTITEYEMEKEERDEWARQDEEEARELYAEMTSVL